ncbi:hypothetical protein GGR95_001838 [Sulfitobacter undariae]|uniref:Uncharacterized protein n=1 Tax=Sulfitobacter undariae TaxID=1563671 RepID=A0A7W6E7P7_9RHOB|nr:hypothetical protein [Sulfitobacter undariae]MBB3994197.1 hypothetical protein [Sulfitobacter undariae]
MNINLAQAKNPAPTPLAPSVPSRTPTASSETTDADHTDFAKIVSALTAVPMQNHNAEDATKDNSVFEDTKGTDKNGEPPSSQPDTDEEKTKHRFENDVIPLTEDPVLSGTKSTRTAGQSASLPYDVIWRPTEHPSEGTGGAERPSPITNPARGADSKAIASGPLLHHAQNYVHDGPTRARISNEAKQEDSGPVNTSMRGLGNSPDTLLKTHDMVPIAPTALDEKDLGNQKPKAGHTGAEFTSLLTKPSRELLPLESSQQVMRNPQQSKVTPDVLTTPTAQASAISQGQPRPNDGTGKLANLEFAPPPRAQHTRHNRYRINLLRQ